MEEKIIDKFYEIIEKYDEYGDTNATLCDIKAFMQECEIKSFQISVDDDVFDSPGLDIYYVMLAWNDSEGLHMVGSPLTRY